MSRRVIGVLLAATLVACAAPAEPSDAPGALVIVASYEQPPAGPISIGGYGFFASVDGGAEVEVPFDGSLRLELPAGAHELTLVTRPASDILVVNEDGESEREFYGVSAECADTIEVAPGDEVKVTYHALGGEDCRLTIDAG